MLLGITTWLQPLSNIREALSFDQTNPVLHLKLGTLLKKQGNWSGAFNAFSEATQLSASYADAWRERGIAENKLYIEDDTQKLSTGETSLSKATTLNPDDFDAYASLGGVLKRAREDTTRRSSCTAGRPNCPTGTPIRS